MMQSGQSIPNAPQRRRKPPLYRLARALRWAGIIFGLLIVVFLVTAAVSMILNPPQFSLSSFSSSGSGGKSNGTCGLPNSVNLGNSYTFNIVVTNNAWYEMTLQLALHANEPSGTPIFQGGSPVVGIPAGSSSTLALTVLTLAKPPPGTQCIIWAWVNASYAYFFTMNLQYEQNGSSNNSNHYSPSSWQWQGVSQIISQANGGCSPRPVTRLSAPQASHAPPATLVFHELTCQAPHFEVLS